MQKCNENRDGDGHFKLPAHVMFLCLRSALNNKHYADHFYNWRLIPCVSRWLSESGAGVFALAPRQGSGDVH